MRPLLLTLLLVGLACGSSESEASAGPGGSPEGPDAASWASVELELHGLGSAGDAFEASSALELVDGVGTVTMDAASEACTVRFDPARVDVETLVATLQRLGLRAEVRDRRSGAGPLPLTPALAER